MIKLKIINILVLFLILLGLSNSAYAQQVTLATMFSNAVDSLHALLDLMHYISYVIGIFLVIGAAFKFTKVGQDGGRTTIKVPLIMFFTGIAIISLTGSLAVVSQTMALGDGPGSLLLPAPQGVNATMAQALQGVFMFIKFIGYIAFIRGFLLLNQYGQGKEGVLGKSFIHILGGAAAINVTIFAEIIANTIAPGLPMPF